jgi:hypothetical protein
MRNNRKKCLVCKEPMARWFYGEPNFEAIKEDLMFRRIILGGCCISNLSPVWACKSCCISYRKDGIGFLDRKLIDKLDNQASYQLPEKFKQILTEDFLSNPKSTRSVGFHFYQGGFFSSMEDIRYLDGILICNHYKHQIYYNAHEHPEIPTYIYILSTKMKKKIDTFISTSKWKRNYVDLGIMDGTQWELKRMFQKKLKNSDGSNDFPEVYEEFMDLLEEIDPELMGWD